MVALTEIAAQLSEPFALDDIDFLPKGKIEKDGKTLCMAFPFADPRVYQDRLNELAPGEWSTPATIAITVGNKLVCYVTVILCGITHTDVGEADPGENQATESWSQGFKRCCSQFGLGRYLYNLDKEWVPFKVAGKSGMIDLDKAGKAAIVRKMYQKAGIATGQAPTPKPALKTVPAQPQAQDAQPETPSVKELQKRCNALFGVGFWQAMILKALKVENMDIVLKDSDLTADDRLAIQKYMDFAEAKKAS